MTSNLGDASKAAPANHAPAGSKGPLLHVKNVEIGYIVDDRYTPAVGNASFESYLGETIMLLGPSGCGKSTLLKAIAGFLEPQQGQILFDGRDKLEPGPDRAVVFQEFDQLFPWRNVRDNVIYPLRLNGRSVDEAGETADRFLDMMGLTRAVHQYPHHLSGGMKQRVAIARAFALEPQMLLMDEPFGSLDAQTRSRLQRELIDIVDRTHVSTLFVTHSIQEAVLIGHRVVVLGHPPSEVKEIMQVKDIKDPDSEEFIEVRRHLRTLLAGDGEDVDHAVFE